MQTWRGIRFWTKPRAFFYSLHYLPKSERTEAVEKEPPHFADGLIFWQPSHHIRGSEKTSLANTGQRSLVSLRGSDLIIEYFLSTCFVRHVSVMGPFFLQNYTQGTKDIDWNLPLSLKVERTTTPSIEGNALRLKINLSSCLPIHILQMASSPPSDGWPILKEI